MTVLPITIEDIDTEWRRGYPGRRLVAGNCKSINLYIWNNLSPWNDLFDNVIFWLTILFSIYIKLYIKQENL